MLPAPCLGNSVIIFPSSCLTIQPSIVHRPQFHHLQLHYSWCEHATSDPNDSCPVSDPSTTTDSSHSRLFALWISIWSTHNLNTLYTCLSCHWLSSAHYVFMPCLSYVLILMSTGKTVSHPGFQLVLMRRYLLYPIIVLGILFLIQVNLNWLSAGLYSQIVQVIKQIDLRLALWPKITFRYLGFDYNDTFSPVQK